MGTLFSSCKSKPGVLGIEYRVTAIDAAVSEGTPADVRSAIQRASVISNETKIVSFFAALRALNAPCLEELVRSY